MATTNRFVAAAGRCLAVASAVMLFGAARAGAVNAPASGGELTAAQIVKKNLKARGGAAAWEKIKTMAWAGHIESSTMPDQAPFLLEQQRPNLTRFEFMVKNQRSVRIYDGTKGWKLHPGRGGAPVVEPYSADELNFARDAQVIGGPLMADVARGATVSLTGTDSIDGHGAYALQTVLPAGARHRIWVDVDTFLEVRYERDFRSTNGRSGVASVRFRNYQPFQGLQLATTVETTSADGDRANKLVIEKVAMNPAFDARMFDKPVKPAARHGGVLVDTRDAQAAAR